MMRVSVFPSVLPALVAVFLSLLLAACVSGPSVQPEVAHYDLPESTAATTATTSAMPTPLRSLDVVPAPWLAGNSMAYRLAYADAGRREHFSASRWAAQPGELVEVRLKRSLLATDPPATNGSGNGNGNGATACRLRLELDDLIQVFDAPERSHMRLDARATLYGAHLAVLGRRNFSLQQQAGADARSGATATAALVDGLTRQLQSWIGRDCRPHAAP